MTDSMIDRYLDTYYDPENDVFSYNDYMMNLRYWNPYLQRFIYDTKCVKKSGGEFMTEIFLTNMNESRARNVFSEWTYINSIYHAVKTKNKITIPMTFFEIKDGCDLAEKKNLPFINTPHHYMYLQPIPYIQNSDIADCTNGYVFMLDPTLHDKKYFYMYMGHKNKVHKLDQLHLEMISENLTNEDLVFECRRNEIEATEVC